MELRETPDRVAWVQSQSLPTALPFWQLMLGSRESHTYPLPITSLFSHV
jgi:hypothetical protein